MSACRCPDCQQAALIGLLAILDGDRVTASIAKILLDTCPVALSQGEGYTESWSPREEEVVWKSPETN